MTCTNLGVLKKLNILNFNMKYKFHSEELISESKGYLRKYIQKFFLLFLSKIAPKKYLLYKNNIRHVMNRGAYLFRLYCAAFYLRLKYPLLLRLPPRQLYAFNLQSQF